MFPYANTITSLVIQAKPRQLKYFLKFYITRIFVKFYIAKTDLYPNSFNCLIFNMPLPILD